MKLIIICYYHLNCQNSLNIGAEIADYTGWGRGKKKTALGYRLHDPGFKSWHGLEICFPKCPDQP
jgi:hypothetical protein